MKKLLFLVLLGSASCTSEYDFRSEEYSGYYPQPNPSADRRLLERRRIMHWTTDPRNKDRIGFLEKYEVTVKGTRSVRNFYYILNAGATDQIGFITDEGKFYRFDANGERVPIGEWQVIDTGLKVFFGYAATSERVGGRDIRHNISLEEIDPYREF